MKPGDPLTEARILIIDDETGNIRLLEMMLDDEHYSNVRSLMDPREAVAVYDEFHPDIILLDLHMPHVDGFQVMGLLKERVTCGAHVPILVLTADIASQTKRRALEHGATDFLTKPFDHTEVLLRVRNLLMTRAAHLQIQSQNDVLETRVEERTAELSKANEDLKSAQLETLDRLAIAAEYRDDDTGLHTRRVGENAARIAAGLGFSEEKIALIRRAAPLHDIGKIGISDSILLKPGKLTPEEFDVMKTHAAIGEAILSGSTSPLLRLAAEIAITHHERWDGSGYPNKLAGEDIPITGRISAVADVYDALTSERPYKRAWTREAANEEIKRVTGAHFDPRVVEAFLSFI